MKRILAFLLMAAMVLSFAGCGDSKEKHSVYFSSSDKKGFAEEKIVLDSNLSIEDKAKALVKRLIDGPLKAENMRAVPENTALLGLRIESKTATVNFSQGFEKTADATTNLLAIYSVVNTLCSMDGINKVQILVNGRKIKYTATEEEIGALSMNNVILADEIGRNQTTVLELYFANEDKTALIGEKRMVDIKDNETVEKAAISELLKGPGARGEKLLTTDFKVLSIEIKDKQCYINFSKEFMLLPQENAELSVFSIVNTLTKLPSISSVQILIEGEKAEQLGKVALTEPFMYNAEFVS